ncbi:MAG: ferrous iron transport protein A [Eubacteriales bacterium]|nr:ferrous iron transport protein A [Eubacteriales bacterium]
MTLDELKIGQSAVIRAVGGEGALRLRLLDMGLIPKTRVTLIKTAPLGDPIEICVRGYELTLRKDDARKIALSEEEGVNDGICACGESKLGKDDAVQCAYGVQSACRKLSGRDGGSEDGGNPRS